MEIKLPGFVVCWLGVGALVAAVPAALELPAPVQWGAFTIVSMSLFAASRTIFRRFLMRGGERVRTGVEAMIGAEAQVVEPLPDAGTGVVRINGELWSAKSLTGTVDPGEQVVVEKVEGLKLHVRRPGQPVAATKGR
ncbi:MAG: NfeD family protein [Myxococcales bacterium]